MAHARVIGIRSPTPEAADALSLSLQEVHRVSAVFVSL